MPKITVTPEGRKDVWLVSDRESLKEYIRSLSLETIHKYVQASHYFIGADFDITSVMEAIDGAKRIAVFTDETPNLGHSLAMIQGDDDGDEWLEMFNIGRIKKKTLNITE